jgi:hypothetical protein
MVAHSGAGLFVDHKKGEIPELKALLRDSAVSKVRLQPASLTTVSIAIRCTPAQSPPLCDAFPRLRQRNGCFATSRDAAQKPRNASLGAIVQPDCVGIISCSPLLAWGVLQPCLPSVAAVAAAPAATPFFTVMVELDRFLTSTQTHTCAHAGSKAETAGHGESCWLHDARHWCPLLTP